MCPQKELAADCFRIRRLYQPLWNRGWWGGRGMAFWASDVWGREALGVGVETSKRLDLSVCVCV